MHKIHIQNKSVQSPRRGGWWGRLPFAQQGLALCLLATVAFVLPGRASADVIQQVNGPPGPGPFFWALDDIGWYWTPAEDVNLTGVQTQLRTGFFNINNNFTFKTTLYTDRPDAGGVEINSFFWNGATFVDGPWVGGSFDSAVALQGGTEYFVGMSGWAQALGWNGGSSGAGINWVNTPLGDPVQNLGEGSSYGSSAGNPGSFDTQFSPSGLGATDQAVLRFMGSVIPEPTGAWAVLLAVSCLFVRRKRV